MNSVPGKIKLLVVCGSYPPVRDGVGDYCQHLYRRLSSRDVFEILILTDAAATGEQFPGLEVRPLVHCWSFKSLPALLKASREFRPDLVHIQYPSIKYKRHLIPNLLPLFLRLAGARKVIITLHGFGLYNWLGKMRLTLAAALSDGIIPVSQHIRGSAGRFWGRLGGSITSRLEETVFTGPSIEPLSDITSDQRKAARAAWRVGPGQLFMAYFGFINDGKGFDDLLKAYRDCLDQQLEVKLVCLAGLETQGNRYHMKMLELIGKLGLKNSVHFTGYLGPREVALALSLADIAVLPFNYGASTKRTTMLAALACGCPVITTGDPSLPEFFRDGENIMLVPPREPVSLARAIMRMGNDPDLRERIKRGTGELSRHFSWDSIADRHLEIYRRYLERDERGK